MSDNAIRNDLIAALAWIDSVPSDAPLPAMPGFERDWVDSLIQGHSVDPDLTLQESLNMALEWIEAVPEDIRITLPPVPTRTSANLVSFAQFDLAVKRLVGEDQYKRLQQSDMLRTRMAEYIALSHFINNVIDLPTKEHDLAIVRQVLRRLTLGDGCSGLID